MRRGAAVKPDLTNDCLHDEHDYGEPEFRNRDQWDNYLEENVDGQYVAGRGLSFKAISMLKSTKNLLSILQVCSEINSEASPLFYKRNQFRIQSSTADYSSALQFLSLLSPATLRSITSFGVAGLQPCEKSTYGRYGVCARTHEFNRKCRFYYKSEDMFCNVLLPRMSLKELSLGFDLSHITDTKENDNMKDYSPQASWLNGCLRLPLKRINLDFGLIAFKDRMDNIAPVDYLIEALNHVDGQSRIRAKYEWEEEYDPCLAHENRHPEARRYAQETGKSLFPFNDIWGFHHHSLIA